MKKKNLHNASEKVNSNTNAVTRRDAVKKLSLAAGVGFITPFVNANSFATQITEIQKVSNKKPLRKIATEEAFCREVRKGNVNLDYKLIAQIYGTPVSEINQSAINNNQTSNRDAASALMLPKLLDTEQLRIADMDANKVDMHLLSLALPGVQIFEESEAIDLAKLANDRMSEAIKKYPKRFAALGCFAPQNVQAATKEMERSVKQLKMNGFLVNSHTGNAYLDDEKFWPIFEAAEALNAPLYIHPRAPSDGMAEPFKDYRLEGAVWGYGIETSTHILRLIFGGVFDRFPKLQVVIGHMGEALPFWLWRLDFMGRPGARAGRKNQLKPSEYFQRNISITTSGVEDPLALRYCIDKIGVDRIMWAIDYPFQPTAPAVSFIENAPLSETERIKIAHANAERIFNINV
jgi:5-carboxyvanillate decarboxylase